MQYSKTKIFFYKRGNILKKEIVAPQPKKINKIYLLIIIIIIIINIIHDLSFLQ